MILSLGNSFIEHKESEVKMTDEIFNEIWLMKPEEKPLGKIFNKIVVFPRYTQSYGLDYPFSGQVAVSKPIENSFLVSILDYVNSLEKIKYNQILVNWYTDGSEYIGEHSDSENEFVNNSSIYSFSFGQTRDFVVKGKDGYRLVILLENNTMVIMGGEMQKFYKHSVPKRSVKKCPEKRINITVRAFKI